MVNAAKRTRALMFLFHIRNGTAAVSLPPPPKPQLISVYMRIPTGEWREVDGEGKAKKSSIAPFKAIQGARTFWRNHLRRLKYRNPALAVTVESIARGYGSPTYMSLRFESPDQNQLRTINTRYDSLERTAQLSQSIAEDKQQAQIAESERVRRDAEVFSHAPKDEITALPQSPADPSTPSSTSPPSTLYTRTVTLPLTHLPPPSIWQWFRQTTGCAEGDTNEAELEEHTKLTDFLNGPSQRDRERVQAGMDAMRAEREQLKKAQEAAAQMASEAA